MVASEYTTNLLSSCCSSLLQKQAELLALLGAGAVGVADERPVQQDVIDDKELADPVSESWCMCFVSSDSVPVKPETSLVGFRTCICQGGGKRVVGSQWRCWNKR